MKTSDHPSLPYNGKSGHVARSKTSTARALHEDATGVTGKRQIAILEALETAEFGKTWSELGNDLNLHHGQISGALSVLHNAVSVRSLKLLLALGLRKLFLVFVLGVCVGHRALLDIYFRELHCICDRLEQDCLTRMCHRDLSQLSDLPLMQR